MAVGADANIRSTPILTAWRTVTRCMGVGGGGLTVRIWEQMHTTMGSFMLNIGDWCHREHVWCERTTGAAARLLTSISVTAQYCTSTKLVVHATQTNGGG